MTALPFDCAVTAPLVAPTLATAGALLSQAKAGEVMAAPLASNATAVRVSCWLMLDSDDGAVLICNEAMTGAPPLPEPPPQENKQTATASEHRFRISSLASLIVDSSAAKAGGVSPVIVQTRPSLSAMRSN